MKSFMFLLLFGTLPAFAASNTDLYSCSGSSPELIKFMYTEKKPAEFKDAAELEFTIGQDKTGEFPIYEISYWANDKKGNRVIAPITLRRVPLALSQTSGAVSVSYAPWHAPGHQNAMTFNIHIAADTTGQIVFGQQNNLGAPNQPIPLDCENLNAPIVLPQPVNIASLSDAQLADRMLMFRRALPQRNFHVGDDDEEKVPAEVTSALAVVKNHAIQMTLNPYMVLTQLKRDADKDKVQATILDPAKRCENPKVNSYGPVKDATGQLVGYSATIGCKSAAATLTYQKQSDEKKPRTDNYGLTFRRVYISSSRVLMNRASWDLTRFYDEEN